MKIEDKQLLLQDLSSRLPYGVICKDTNINVTGTLSQIGLHYDMCVLDKDNGDSESCYILNCKPYLFPLESMTVEQQKEANLFDDMDMDILSKNLGRNHRNKTNIPTATYNYTDWLNKNHFDYRGLIEKGLAIDATELNIY